MKLQKEEQSLSSIGTGDRGIVEVMVLAEIMEMILEMDLVKIFLARKRKIILGVLGGGPVTGMGDFDKGPCVGVCYYIKKRGIKIDSSMKV